MSRHTSLRFFPFSRSLFRAGGCLPAVARQLPLLFISRPRKYFKRRLPRFSDCCRMLL